MLSGDGPFSNEAVEWLAFLDRVGGDATSEHAFVARNFLLDEGVPDVRVRSYRDQGCVADHGTVEGWLGAHERYLIHRVFLDTSDTGPPKHLDPAEPDECSETFRHVASDSPFLSSDGSLTLIRVEEADFIARYAGIPKEGLLRMAEAAVTAKAYEELDDILDQWATAVQMRPTFAAYTVDVEDLVEEGAPPDWADRLRDRLGLAHLDPRARGVPHIDVVVFRYPVSEVASLRGMNHGTRPLMPPTVLDGKHSAAFCPAPRGLLTGHTIDLQADVPEPVREVIHPTLAYEARHVWRVGRIVEPVDLDLLPEARGIHLSFLRDRSDNEDYASQTDGDLQ